MVNLTNFAFGNEVVNIREFEGKVFGQRVINYHKEHILSYQHGSEDDICEGV